tara:strand:- start:349 stop:570 length:222 start_codon:yes stop_codon:yes gene_type:complete
MEPIDNLINRFNSIKDTHPELSKIWINYLIIKKTKLNNLINQGEKTLEILSHSDDISIENILTLVILNQNKFI